MARFLDLLQMQMVTVNVVVLDDQVITTQFAVGSHFTSNKTCPAWLFAVPTPLMLPPRLAAFDSRVKHGGVVSHASRSQPGR
jgi:hypothetical protein